MAVPLPVTATLTEGKGGRSVLIDPHGIQMMAQSQSEKLRYYCSKTRVFEVIEASSCQQ